MTPLQGALTGPGATAKPDGRSRAATRTALSGPMSAGDDVHALREHQERASPTGLPTGTTSTHFSEEMTLAGLQATMVFERIG